MPGSVLAVLAATACSAGQSAGPGGGAPPASSIDLARCSGAGTGTRSGAGTGTGTGTRTGSGTGTTAAARNGLPGITLPCLGKGPAVDVAGIAGPAVINLWASWCYPCRQEMPLLQHESEALAGKVRVVGVDTNDQAASAVAFAENTVRAGYEELSDPAGKLAASLHAPGLPFTVAIDRDGGIVWRKAGQLTAGDIGRALRAARAGSLRCPRRPGQV